MVQALNAGKSSGVDQDIRRLLADAADERRRGLSTSDVDVLREHLVAAWAEAERVSRAAAGELEAMAERVTGLEAEADCGISDLLRRSGKPCDGYECTACRLAWAAMEKDCGAADERRTAGLCAASHLGVDRCCECAAHLLKIETDGEIEERDAEIARLTRERDAARVEAAPRAVVTKARLAKVDEGPSLFDRLEVAP